jgi:hypothetical protein
MAAPRSGAAELSGYCLSTCPDIVCPYIRILSVRGGGAHVRAALKVGVPHSCPPEASHIPTYPDTIRILSVHISGYCLSIYPDIICVGAVRERWDASPDMWGYYPDIVCEAEIDGWEGRRYVRAALIAAPRSGCRTVVPLDPTVGNTVET